MRAIKQFKYSMLFLASILPGIAMAANAIQQIQVRRDGDTILLKVQMQDPIKTAPGTWSIVEPPRVVFDFPDTDNRTGNTVQTVTEGELKSLNLVQADSLTRLVLNLHRSTKYTSEVDGRFLFIKLNAQPQKALAESAPSAYQRPATATPVAQSSGERASVRDIAFRRGENGQGLVLIDLTDGSVPVDVRRAGNGLVVQIQSVDLPERLLNKRDVNDFATLVSGITTKRSESGVQLEIAATGRWFHQSKVVNDQLIIEIDPIPADEANKLVQTGEQGKKVSINFYEAEATMVLRTLAEISGKNLMIDPSLAGRKVTVALENISYDQALEIVMAQVNAGIRIRNDVVLFGDRAVLQKRDQDAADELTRANDTAALVSETFELNYVKVAEIVSLLNSSFSQQGAAAAPPAGAQAAAPVATAGKGMLSARGSMSQHDQTNKLFVRDTAERIEAIRQVLRSVDIPAKQVLIEARIVRADNNFNRSLGLRLGYNDLSNTVTGRGIGSRLAGTNVFGTVATTSSDLLALTGQSSGGGATVGAVGSASPQINLPSLSSPTGQFAISVFNSSLTKFINLELQASENEGRTTNISSPRVVTENNLEAKIERGTKIPYSTASSTGTNTQFIDAKLSLAVKPQIAPNGTVIMELTVTNDSVGTGSPPSINTTSLKTKVTVENGGTVVLGGVITDDTASTEARIPFLSDIPYIGSFFKSTQTIHSKGELLIFITPRVLSQSIAAAN